MRKLFFFIFLFSLFQLTAFSQHDSSLVRLVGKVFDPKVQGLSYSVMVVNKSKGIGSYGESDGSFNITFNRKDTIYISTMGYKLVKLCYADSAPRKVYSIHIPIEILHYNLNAVTIFAPRDLNEIKKDIDKLGYTKRDYQLSGIDAARSPITFLYQQFSRKEQKIREAHEYANDMRRRDLLKELFIKYVQHDIIALEENQFDRFIDFCNISDATLQRMSQYDFIMYIKERYRIFSIVDGDDYYFDR